MRHLKSGRALGVKPAHRRAMLRNMVTSLLEHQRITTTLARAKELRRPLDQMITLGKKGDLASRRRALAFVKSKAAMANLFGSFAERYAERPGGFSRIIALGPRRGDGAAMAIVQLVDAPNDPFVEPAQPKRRGEGRRRGRKVVDEVVEEVTDKAKPAAKGKAAKADKNASDTPAETADEAPDKPAEGHAAEGKAAEGKAAGDDAAAESEDGKTPKG